MTKLTLKETLLRLDPYLSRIVEESEEMVDALNETGDSEAESIAIFLEEVADEIRDIMKASEFESLIE